MKLVIFSLLFTVMAWARPTVLVSYFDPYGGARLNNSETVAKIIAARAPEMDLPFDIKFCKTQTKFDVSYEELKTCLRKLPETPVMVLGLGEASCSLKIEIMARNLDKTYGPDNAGVERKNTPIVKDAPPAIGFNYPLAEMYCALGANDRKNITISNSAGSFVCNNLAFQTSWFETHINFGFIHVPAHSCRGLKEKNEDIALSLITMINRAVEVIQENPNLGRLPVMKSEFERARAESTDSCIRQFWKSAKAFDEKNRSF